MAGISIAGTLRSVMAPEFGLMPSSQRKQSGGIAAVIMGAADSAQVGSIGLVDMLTAGVDAVLNAKGASLMVQTIRGQMLAGLSGGDGIPTLIKNLGGVSNLLA